MAIAEWTKDSSVAILTMNNGENRHNPAFAKAMTEALSSIEEDQSISSVVITSSDPKCWSLGIDLEWMTKSIQDNRLDDIRAFMYDLNEMFKKILTFPMPVIAAINGHTFGDGTVLACTCDFRFMKADKGYFCFPEVDINIPFLPSMLETIRKAIPAYKMEEIIFSGKKLGAAELEEHSIIVKSCEDQDELMAETLAFARTFSKGRSIFAQHKIRLHKGIIDAMETEDPEYIEPLNLTA